MKRRFSGIDGEELSEMTQISHDFILKEVLKSKEQDGSYIPVTIPSIPQLRKTRRIDGIYTIDDTEMHKHFDDSVGLFSDWRKRGPVYELPFGTLYGKKIKNLICAGRCISVTDSMWEITRVNNVDVVLGRDSFDEYLDNRGCFGTLIGRNANRIENAEFCLNGVYYKLVPNNGRNNLHGGQEGFNKKVWESNIIDEDEPSLELMIISPDGDEGFPGEVNVKVTYTLTKDNSLVIRYEGETTKDTVLNMTNHTYFNLNGHNSGKVDKHTLWLESNFYTPNNEEGIPTGEVLSVINTAMDFSKPKTIGECVNSGFKQITMFDGLDHNFAINGFGYRLFGELIGDKTGIKMKMYTDCKGVQLYTGNKMETDRICKENSYYVKHGGICFETQAFPNCIKYSHFPNSILKKGEKFTSITAYKFTK